MQKYYLWRGTLSEIRQCQILLTRFTLCGHLDAGAFKHVQVTLTISKMPLYKNLILKAETYVPLEPFTFTSAPSTRNSVQVTPHYTIYYPTLCKNLMSCHWMEGRLTCKSQPKNQYLRSRTPGIQTRVRYCLDQDVLPWGMGHCWRKL